LPYSITDVIERAKRQKAMREAATEARQEAQTLRSTAEDAKAEAVSRNAPHHQPLRVLSDINVSVSAGAPQGMKEKLEEAFAEHGRTAV
jgi:hypothetical protein